MLDSLFVILGASIWATDTLFRHPLVSQLSASSIVLIEHLIAATVSGVVLLTLAIRKIVQGQPVSSLLRWCIPSGTPLLGIAVIGILGSALATVLFTTSFQFINPTVTILLQKFQPLVVILLSTVFLKERLPRFFWLFTCAALISAFFLSFPSGLPWHDIQEALADDSMKGIILALSAAIFWAISTVIGRAVLSPEDPQRNISTLVLSFWRFFFGLIAMGLIYFKSIQVRMDLAFVTFQSPVTLPLFYMAIVPGLLGVSLYYRGLSKVQASVATLLELSFPLCALLMNSIILKMPLQNIQLIAATGLLSSILALSLLSKRSSPNSNH